MKKETKKENIDNFIDVQLNSLWASFLSIFHHMLYYLQNQNTHTCQIL